MSHADTCVFDSDIGTVDLAPRSSRRKERTDSHSITAMEFALQWQSQHARHTDCLVQQKFNLWRDLLPPELEAELEGKPVGYTHAAHFAPGTLIPPYRADDCLRVRTSAFNRRFRKRSYVVPRGGRFYPKGFIAGVRGLFAQDMTPFRVGEVGDELTIDLNHPLAGQELTLASRILDIWSAGDEHGGRCNEVGELVTAGGPGMQARWRGQPTDFWSDIPFIRSAPGPDTEFYRNPRFVDHIDRTASERIEQLYARLVPAGGRVLDLMASWKSHLPGALALDEVVGLGMNREELDANPLLGDRRVHDLNLSPALPFDDAAFDAVVCTVSVEYLTEPVQVFAEVNRVLRLGGRFVVTFSNRWFPPKVVRVWEDIHEFERPGLVLEYLLKAGGYRDLETWSLRGLPRPRDDKYADRLAFSDPVYAVWGVKI